MASPAPSVVRRPPLVVWDHAPAIVAAVVPVLVFFVLPPLDRSGLWDPYELNVADLSRRVALNLMHATSLALDNADNTLPHLNDLGRPQLPFSLIALGFKLFGLHEWAGRLPLAIFGLVGALATYAFVARLFDRRAGAYASVVLSTMPLYFVQARSMLGDVCAMAALALSFGGLAVGAFDRQPFPDASKTEGAGDAGPAFLPTDARARAPWLAMAAVGLFAGFETRGGLLGLAVPLLGVGLAWGISRVAVRRATPDLVGDVVGAVALVSGGAVAVVAARVLADPPKDLDLWVGALVHAPSKYPTFDSYIAAVGHSVAPWSAFVPFALGRLLITPGVLAIGVLAAERESLGRLAILVGSTVAFVAHACLSAQVDLIAFTAPALLAVACAIAIRDFERGAQASVAVGLGTLVFAGVLHHDFHELPEKAFQAFGIVGASFPEGFKDKALILWWVVLGGFALCAFLTWIEREADRAPFAPATYARVLTGLAEIYNGNLAYLYGVLVAGASFAAVLLYFGLRTHARWLPALASNTRDIVLNAWWVLAIAPFAAIFGILFACDLWLWTFGRSRPLSRRSLTRGFEPFEELAGHFRRMPSEAIRKAAPADGTPDSVFLEADDERLGLTIAALFVGLAVPALVLCAALAAGAKAYVALLVALPSGLLLFLVLGLTGDLLRHRGGGLAAGGAVVGVVLCVFYYPALASQLSPKEVFESYRHVCPDGPLALLGVGGRTSAYYAGGQPQVVSDANAAYQWLSAGPGGPRRCLALKADELPKLNELWRQHAEPRTNVPVLDARSSQILLAASALRADETNQNPLAQFVLAAPPRPQRIIEANLDDKLQVLGIDIVDDRGRKVDVVSAQRPYSVRTYYRVLAPLTSEWESFIHIDGYHRRHNGDHKPMNGKYPLSLWLAGDLLVDTYEFKLEPNFTQGTYDIYFGLFVGDTRLKVVSGPNDGDNRINGGQLRVQ